MDAKQTLSEISHLFLSEVRERTSGGPRPRRVPPPGQAMPPAPAMSPEVSHDSSVDMTPEEFAASMEAPAIDPQPKSSGAPDHAMAEVSIVLAAHLLDNPAQKLRLYARHLAASCGRVGIIQVDNADFSLMCFESANATDSPAQSESIENLDPRRISETLAELSFDMHRWLVFLPNPRAPEARHLLRQAPHWVLLTTADHDGVVATYRVLKGLADLHKPRISLVVLDARDDAHAQAVFQKLDAVSRQFLGCAMERQSPVHPALDVIEHQLLQGRVAAGKTADAPHWGLLADFLAGSLAPAPSPAPAPAPPMPVMEPAPAPKIPVAAAEEVIGLTDDSDIAILEAIVRQGGVDGRWIQCPIKAPMCPSAIVAIGRERQLMLVASAGRGLTELRSIGQALRWMKENRDLIRMAMPQLSIDTDQEPAVRLLVDRADLSAELLQPLLQSDTVIVQAYRKLRWAGRPGLLLDAA